MIESGVTKNFKFALSSSFSGFSPEDLASSLGLFMCLASQQIVVNTNDIGTIGVGTGIGFGLSVPPTIQQEMLSSLLSNGIAGPMAPSLSEGLSNGFRDSFLQAFISTASPSVGIGTGTVSLSPPPSSFSLILSCFAPKNLVGPMSTNLARAISSCFDSFVSRTTGLVIISGPPGPTISSGKGIGRII